MPYILLIRDATITMESLLVQISSVDNLLRWILFSLGLQQVLKKLRYDRLWHSWVPGLRYYAYGKAMELPVAGMLCGSLEFVSMLISVLYVFIHGERAQDALSLFTLVVIITLFAYRIRLHLRLISVFGLRKRWIIVFLVASWLPLMIFGFRKKHQPKQKLSFTEEWEAGTEPAAMSTAIARRNTAVTSGLSIDIRERTVRDFGKKKYLLKDIAMDIPNGSFVLLLGGSGAGKTTFVNAVIGYEKADATIILNGCDVYKQYNQMKYRIGFVPQQNLIRGCDTVIRTVGDAAQMRLPRKVKSRDRSRKVDEVLDLLGLAAGSDGLVSKKSGGQLRRISIAMELVTDPELFVLDEPDSGLDGVIAREIFTKLREIADTGKIVMVITHTPDRVIDLFDKVIVVAKDSGRVGRLAFYGSPEEARAFFGRDTMEEIVMSVNRKEEGGEGLADEFIERYAELTNDQEGGAAA